MAKMVRDEMGRRKEDEFGVMGETNGALPHTKYLLASLARVEDGKGEGWLWGLILLPSFCRSKSE